MTGSLPGSGEPCKREQRTYCATALGSNSSTQICLESSVSNSPPHEQMPNLNAKIWQGGNVWGLFAVWYYFPYL